MFSSQKQNRDRLTATISISTGESDSKLSNTICNTKQDVKIRPEKKTMKNLFRTSKYFKPNEKADISFISHVKCLASPSRQPSHPFSIFAAKAEGGCQNWQCLPFASTPPRTGRIRADLSLMHHPCNPFVSNVNDPRLYCCPPQPLKIQHSLSL